MAEKDKRYYWLKLKRDFFKRHDIQIIENMPNGKDYILFYLKLLCESVDHDGNLRFSEQIPYDENMLATITNTNVDIVRSAIKIFTELHMMDVMDDGTFHMTEVRKMLGSETYWAQKKREQRVIEAKDVGHFPTVSNTFPTCPSKSIEKEKDTDEDINNIISDSDEPEPPAPVKKSKPVKHKHGEYKHVLLTDEEVDKLKKEYGEAMTGKAIVHLDEYIEMKGYKAKSHYLAIRKWVVDAVKEKERKQGRKEMVPDWMNKKPKNAFNGYSNQREYDFDALEKEVFCNEKTIDNDPELAARAEALKKQLGGV